MYLEVTEAWITTDAPTVSLEITEVWIEAVSAGNIAPVAQAGSAQTVEPWATVTLDGSASQDPDGGTLTNWIWSQTAGTSVSLNGSGPTRTFQAPPSISGGSLTFSLTVSDGIATSPASTVNISVMPVTERAIIAGQEVPMQIRATSGNILSWHALQGGLKRRGQDDQIGNFYAFEPGTLKPLGHTDAGGPNIGPRIPLTVHNGDITINTGQTVSGLEIFGRVFFAGTGTLRDCIVRGWTSSEYTSSTGGIIMGGTPASPSYNLKGSLIEWCRIDATGRESLWANGVGGGNYTCQYTEITRTNDGISATQVGNATIKCCRIHNGYFTAWHADNPAVDTGGAAGAPIAGWPSSPSDHRSHSDAIQLHQFSGWVITGNYIGGVNVGSGLTGTPYLDPRVPSDQNIIAQIDDADDYPNAGILMASASANSIGALIEKNWFHGSASRINMDTKPQYDDYLQTVTLRDNRYIRSTWPSPGFYIYMRDDCQAVMSGNVFDDTGLPVPVNTYP